MRHRFDNSQRSPLSERYEDLLRFLDAVGDAEHRGAALRLGPVAYPFHNDTLRKALDLGLVEIRPAPEHAGRGGGLLHVTTAGGRWVSRKR